MDWLDSFNQEIQETQQPQSQPIAPAQLQPEIQKEPILPMSTADSQNRDWLDAFDVQVQETQKILEVPQDVKSGKTFESWFDEKYSGTKEFLEASGESMVQLGYGAVSFLPSYGLGFATVLNEKLKNLLRQDRIAETERKGGFPTDRLPTDLARKPMVQRLEEAKIKTPKEIRDLANRSSEFFASVMGEPVTPGGKKVIGKAGEFMEWLFHYPKQADEKLSEAGYPNLGYLTGFAGEMLLLKGLHGAAKKGKAVGKNVISRYIKTVEDVKSIKTPADLKAVDRQVNKILDQLGISEEQRIIATDKTFRARQDVGSWMEERTKIRETKTKVAEIDESVKEHIKKEFNLSDKEAADVVAETRREVSSAEEIRRETEAPIKEERLVEEAPERLRVRDVEKDRLEAPKERKVEVSTKPVLIASSPRGSQISLEFDNRLGTIPTVKTIKAYGKSKGYDIDVTKFKGGLRDEVTLGGIRDTTLFRLDVWKEGKLDSKAAVDLAEHFGGDFQTPSAKLTGIRPERKRLEAPKEEIDFKTTEQAVKFGKKASSVQISELQRLRKDAESEYQKLTDEGKLEKAGEVAVKAQFYREAFEVAEKPISVQKLNIEAEFGKRVAGEISDGVKIAEDMGVYETIRSGIEGKKKVGEIVKEIKKERYYEEDLKDFGYSEKDLRSAIRAIKVEEFGDRKIAGEITKRLEKEIEKKPKVAKPVKPTVPKVDVEKGRPAGVEADLKKYERPSKVREEVMARQLRQEVEMAPIRTAGGKLVGSKVLAGRLAKERGLVGDVVRTSDGKGWYVKKTEEMRKAEVDATKKLWDGMLEEEGLGVIDILKGERGSIVIEPEIIKRLRSAVKQRKVSEVDVIKEMQRRKVPNSQILKAFPNAFKKTPVEGESKWLGRRDDPEDFLARRVVKKKTGKMKYARMAPAVTRGDAHVVATVTKDLPRPIFSEKIRTLATSEGLFTQLGRPLKETFYYPMRKAAKAENDFVTTLVKESNRMKKTFSLGTRQRHAERIEKYSIAQQKDGAARLKAQGVKDIPKTLTSKEKVVYDEQQKIYRALFTEINKARRAAGQQLFPLVENYSPWFHDLVKLQEFEKINILDDLGKINQAMTRLREIPSQIEKVSRAPGLAGHEKFRAGPGTPGFLHLNSFDNFNAYAKLAGRAIHIGPTTAYLHELLLPRYKLAESAPNTWRFVSDWLDYQKGHEPVMYVTNPVTRRRMGNLSSNVAVSYVTFNWGSFLNQASSINNTITLIGLPRTVEGFARLMNPTEHKRAAAKSDILTVRAPEVALMQAGRPYPWIPGKAGRTISDLGRQIKTYGSAPLMLNDGLIAKASWLGAEAKGKRIYKTSKTYKEMPETKRAKAMEEFSKHYADDVVEQAQGSATRAARAPFQRTAEGAAMSTLQTFVIANFDFLSRQVLGIKNPDITNIQRVQRLTRYVASTAAIAYAFDFMGMRSPVPDPVKAAREEAEKLGYVTDIERYTKVSKAIGKEMLEYVPIYGGKFKYGSEFGGALVNELVRLGTGDTTAIPRLLGIPGFQQFLKSYRAAERGGTDIDVIFGRYIKEPKIGRTRRQRR